MKNQKKIKIKVLPVDDHPVVLEGVRSCLTRYDQFNVVGMACSGEEAISKISLEAYRLFDRLARASEYGRVISPGNSSR